MGGSITAGQGSFDAPNWPQWLFNYMEDNYGAGAAHGMNTCVDTSVGGQLSWYEQKGRNTGLSERLYGGRGVSI